jgi:small subunit ribosomal protein S19
MARSVWKGPFVDLYLLKMVMSGKNVIKTWSRRSTIIPEFVGITFNVHNGKKFIPVVVNEDMVGHKLGAYSPTRTYFGHAGNKKAKRN